MAEAGPTALQMPVFFGECLLNGSLVFLGYVPNPIYRVVQLTQCVDCVGCWRQTESDATSFLFLVGREEGDDRRSLLLLGAF